MPLARREVLGYGAGAAALAAAGSLVRATMRVPDMSELSLEEKVGQLFLLAFEGTTAKDAKMRLSHHLMGGVYLSQANLVDVRNAVTLMNDLQQIGGRTPHRLPIFAGCDQEGAWCVLPREATRGPGNMALGAGSAAQVESRAGDCRAPRSVRVAGPA